MTDLAAGFDGSGALAGMSPASSSARRSPSQARWPSVGMQATIPARSWGCSGTW